MLGVGPERPPVKIGLNTSEVVLGGPLPKRGGTPTQKNRFWRGLKLQTFGVEGAENFDDIGKEL